MGVPRFWTIEEAESLLSSLAGVLSARIVARPGGAVEEVHVLTTEAVSPKQTVRNVESALLAHFDLAVDHRKISVAQTSKNLPPQSAWGVSAAPAMEPPVRRNDRILFVGFRVEMEASHRVRATVELEWQGESYQGVSSGASLPKTRMEALAGATLRAVEATVEAVRVARGTRTPPVVLAVEGVKEVDAFDRKFVLVAVHAMRGRTVVSLAGAAGVDGNPDQAVILAALVATDRWVRGTNH
jgi:hypothetical protein